MATTMYATLSAKDVEGLEPIADVGYWSISYHGFSLVRSAIRAYATPDKGDHLPIRPLLRVDDCFDWLVPADVAAVAWWFDQHPTAGVDGDRPTETANLSLFFKAAAAHGAAVAVR